MPLPQIPKKFLPLIIAGVLGIVAVVMINGYIEQQKQLANRELIEKQENLATVVIARQDIPEGSVLKDEMLKEVKTSKNNVQPGAAVSIERVLGKVTIVPLQKGQQVILSSVSIPQQQQSLSMKIPKGKRAISISVDNISSVGGMIRHGDHVDVVGLVPLPVRMPDGKTAQQVTTIPLFQNVLVLAVGGEFGNAPQKTEGKSSSPVITLALSPEEANLITFAQEQGRIRLVLRSPEDSVIQPVVPASWDTLLRSVMPQMPEDQMQEQVKPQKTVEIIRGTQKETKVLP